MQIFIIWVLVVATVAAFLLTVAKKWGVIEYVQVHGNDFFIDFFNRKPEKLFWPWKKGFCLGFCSARGLVNRALLGCGMVSLAVVLVLSAPAGRLMAKIMRAIYG